MFRLETLYRHLILTRPSWILFLFGALVLFFGYWIRDFRVDSSAESFVLESDQDVHYYREIKHKYIPGGFLSVIYKPHDGHLFSDKNLSILKTIQDEIKDVNGVSSVTSLLNIPLFKSPPIPLDELSDGLVTLESDRVDKSAAIQEIKDSDLYRNLLISRDLQSSALQVKLFRDLRYEDLRLRRRELSEKRINQGLSAEEKDELAEIKREFRVAHDQKRDREKSIVRDIRAILDKHRTSAKVYLAGVPMISNDMIAFVNNDLMVFGIGIFVFFVITLSVIFRNALLVCLPVLCCITSVILMMGFLGLFGLEVTVISANFISLQLIFTLAFAIHLIVRFNELLPKRDRTDARGLIWETVHTIFKPCLYTALTTMAGFSSLFFCDILPVVNFGWMMCMGIGISFLVTFTLFPSAVLVFKKNLPTTARKPHFQITALLAGWAEKRTKTIIFVSCVVIVITVIGVFQLNVENSFIDYFKKSTEIYQGLKYFDQNFGGTTPLDVIIDFPGPEDGDNGDDEYDDEYGSDEDLDVYWFTEHKLRLISDIHDYREALPHTGKTLSFKSYTDLMAQINDGKELDNYDLKIVLRKLPQKMKDIIISPYVSTSDNQARVTVNIRDSNPNLRRDTFLKTVRADLKKHFCPLNGKISLTNVMVLYNKMLQSLYQTQIKSIGFTILLLMTMFLILFRSIKLSIIAIIPNIISCFVILGVMGITRLSLDMMTITIVAISIGIAVDNTIHYIHRFKREFTKDGDYLKTMYRCHGSIGMAMYYTSTTIIVGFSILALSDFIPSITFGLLTSLAMLMALTGALTLLPILIRVVKPFKVTTDGG
jgi:predicted RND superfamily exporter protein